MPEPTTVIATFKTHDAAGTAIKTLTAGGVPMKHLSIVGKGYHTEENITGFYNIGDRVKVWGSRGAFWGALWGLFVGGAFISLPVTGPIIALGFVAATLISAVEGAVIVGGLSALGAALLSIGVPKDSVLDYETTIATDGFLVMASGTPDEMTHAKILLAAAEAHKLNAYTPAT